MIKVQIHEPFKDRNEPTFRMMMACKDYFKQIGIEFTNSNDFDYLFIGMNDFINKKLPLEQSVEWGSENVEKLSQGGDYFLFDGSDSTSLMGAFEVFVQSEAIYLFKNQILKNKEDYNNNYAFGKWFFGNGSGLDLSYEISEHSWNKIKLTNINCGRTIFGTGITPHLNQMSIPKQNKSIDLCAIFQGEHPKCYDHKVRNDIPYTNHRKGLWNQLQKLDKKYKMIADKLPFEQYINNLKDSKICLSPFGMGELCFRDFESILMGTILLRPDQSNIITSPNIYVEGETYIGCKLDWSDLEEKIDYILNNFNELNQKINYNAQKMLKEEYTYESFCKYYYDIFNNLDTIREG